MYNEKKHEEITGYLLQPLHVGAPAVVNERTDWRRTSAVIKMNRMTEHEISFETRNSRYRLHLVPDLHSQREALGDEQ